MAKLDRMAETFSPNRFSNTITAQGTIGTILAAGITGHCNWKSAFRVVRHGLIFDVWRRRLLGTFFHFDVVALWLFASWKLEV